MENIMFDNVLLESIINEKELQTLLNRYCNLWEGTCFENYNRLPQTIKGKFGELIVSKYLIALGNRLEKRTNAGNDFIINGKKIENKFSLCVSNYNKKLLMKDHFIMNHVSKEKDYDILCFLGCNHPSENSNVFFWMYKHEVIEEISLGNYFSNQQGGKKLNNDDYMSSGHSILSLYHKYSNRDINSW
jgi:hypothetical protein